MSSVRSDFLVLLMAAASATAEQINAAVVAGGHPTLRPAHGLVFACVSGEGASVSEIGEHLGITKQSAASIVDGLVSDGYLTRSPHPHDGRAYLVTLTRRGRAAADIATQTAQDQWCSLVAEYGAKPLQQMTEILARIGSSGRLRPVW